jgi:hypothetical protein
MRSAEGRVVRVNDSEAFLTHSRSPVRVAAPAARQPHGGALHHGHGMRVDNGNAAEELGHRIRRSIKPATMREASMRWCHALGAGAQPGGHLVRCRAARLEEHHAHIAQSMLEQKDIDALLIILCSMPSRSPTFTRPLPMLSAPTRTSRCS